MDRNCTQCNTPLSSCDCADCCNQPTFCSEICAMKFIASLSPEEVKAIEESLDMTGES